MEGDKHKGFEYMYDCRCCTSGHKTKGDNTMNLNPIKQNMTEVTVNRSLKVLFSYKTPVACMWANGDLYEYFQTKKKWSRTTSRHINQWLDGNPAKFFDQEYFDQLTSQDGIPGSNYSGVK